MPTMQNESEKKNTTAAQNTKKKPTYTQIKWATWIGINKSSKKEIVVAACT